MSQYQIQMVVNLTKAVKGLLIANIGIWIVFILIGQGFIFERNYIFEWFGLVPGLTVQKFFIWQPVTYMFVHSQSVFHILFNMLVLWMFGSDLEQRWGLRFFLKYYFVCGVGAALIYLVCVFSYFFITGQGVALGVPVVGASGAIFGLILAYGIVFGERTIYFMMLFPMKAKYFAMIIAGVEIVSLLSSGLNSEISNLAHLGGLASGYLFLIGYTKFQQRKTRNLSRRNGRNLKLVVDNEKEDASGPRYWN